MPRRDRPDAAGLAAWRGFLRVHQTLIAVLDRDLQQRHGIPLAWYDVLVQLHEADEELSMGELAGRLLISPATCTRVIDRMHTAGLLTRRVDDADARVRYVGLTPAGRSLLRAAAITHLAGIERHFSGVLGGDARHLADRFDEMLETLDRSASDRER